MHNVKIRGCFTDFHRTGSFKHFGGEWGYCTYYSAVPLFESPTAVHVLTASATLQELGLVFVCFGPRESNANLFLFYFCVLFLWVLFRGFFSFCLLGPGMLLRRRTAARPESSEGRPVVVARRYATKSSPSAPPTPASEATSSRHDTMAMPKSTIAPDPRRGRPGGDSPSGSSLTNY